MFLLIPSLLAVSAILPPDRVSVVEIALASISASKASQVSVPNETWAILSPSAQHPACSRKSSDSSSTVISRLSPEQCNGSSENVMHLSDVAWPGVRLENPDDFRVDADLSLSFGQIM